MNKLLCTVAAAVLGTMVGGCTLYFGGDDDHVGDDDICNGAGGGISQAMRDPSTGQCESGYDGDGCYNEPTPVPQLDWAVCGGACDSLDETTCLGTSGCRAAYLEDLTECPAGAACPVSYEFWGCWGTAPSGPIEGSCDGLDAQGCSEHDDCSAVYQTTYDSGDTSSDTLFSYCVAEAGNVGCYSDADCPGGYTCSTATECNPPPGCDPSNGQPCPDTCYGTCVPAQNGCDTVDCAPGTHCELECTDPMPCNSLGCDGSCGAVCVPDVGTCADGTVCPDGSHCETDCTMPDPSCDGGPMGCPGTCSSTCVPDGNDPGTCDGQVMCDLAPPACPDGTTPGISNGCWSGYCIPLADCGPNNPGSCDGPIVCNSAPPACPDGTTAGIANGCYTGYCLPLSSCAQPPPSCEALDETSCSARPDCTPIYTGQGCTCAPDGTCTCGTWTFDHCQTNAIVDPPTP